MDHHPRGVVSRRAALGGIGTIALAACSGGTGSFLASKAANPSSRRMHLDIISQGSGGSPRVYQAAATTGGPSAGEKVDLIDGLFTGYDSSGAFFAQIDTSTEDANGMPIMKVVTGNGTTATVTFPDLSTLTPGVAWPFTFQGQSYTLLADTGVAGNVRLQGPDGSVTTIGCNQYGDRVMTDAKGKQFTLTGTEIERIGGLVYPSASPSPAPTMTTLAHARRPAQATQSPSGSPSPSGTPTASPSGSGTPMPTSTPSPTSTPTPTSTPSPTPSPTATPCTAADKAKCERLRDAIFLLYYMALAAIALIGIGCVAGAWFAAAFCTIGVAIALAAATAQMLRSVRLFNFGYCAKTCHVYA